MERTRANNKGAVSEKRIEAQKQVVISLQTQYAQLREQFDKRRTSVFRYAEDQQDALQQAIATGNISLLGAGGSMTLGRRSNVRRSQLPSSFYEADASDAAMTTGRTASANDLSSKSQPMTRVSTAAVLMTSSSEELRGKRASLNPQPARVASAASTNRLDDSDDDGSDSDVQARPAVPRTSELDVQYDVADPNVLEESLYGGQIGRQSLDLSIEKDYDSFESEIVFDKANKSVVVAGTLDGLLAHLVPTPDSRPDATYTMGFLFAYRIFISPVQLLDKISEHYMALLDAVLESSYMDGAVRTTRIMLLRYLMLFRIWVQQFGRDFRDPEVANKMKKLIDATEMLHTAHTTPFNQLINGINKINGYLRSNSSSAMVIPQEVLALAQSDGATSSVTRNGTNHSSPVLSRSNTSGESSPDFQVDHTRSPSFSSRNILISQLKRASATGNTPPGTPPLGRDRSGLLPASRKSSGAFPTPPPTAAGSSPAPPLVDQPIFTKEEAATVKDLVTELRHQLNERIPQLASRDASQLAEKMYSGATAPQLIQGRRGSMPNLALLTKADTSFANHNILNISKSLDKIAANLVWRDYHLFAAVQPEEFVMHLQHHTVTTQDELSTLNLNAYVTWFNTLSYWVATQACLGQNAVERCKAIEKFIKIARQCLKYNSFNCLMAILSGLNNSSVQRLKNSWAIVRSKRRSEFLALEELMRPGSNFAQYRELFDRQLRRNLEKASLAQKQAQKAGARRSVTPSTPTPANGLANEEASMKLIDGGADAGSGHSNDFFVPFFTLAIKDLYVLNDANPNVLSNGLINFHKLSTIAERITHIISFRRAPPAIQADFAKMQPYVSALQFMQDDALYALSLQREPRTSLSSFSNSADLKKKSFTQSEPSLDKIGKR
ncbi:RasGEF domain-containing protein, variant [Capsaspora owczarzaki ATCC 30864]|nr:RasGEF domain-containing protein, variant [Capsaspora owczarzaki ATCC 30864]